MDDYDYDYELELAYLDEEEGGAFLCLDDESTRPPVNVIDLHRGYAAEDHLWAERYRLP